MSKLYLYILFFLTLNISVWGQNTKIFKKPAYTHASVGICVLDASTSKTVAGINVEQSVVPASVIKLVTTSVALEVFGPDHRFETKLEYSGQILNGVLTGDLFIKGGGDPSLGSRHLNGNAEDFLNEWVQAVKDAGIREIKGRIIADATIFDDEPVSPYWLWEDMGNYYAAGVYGLAAFDNSFQLELRSGEVGTRPEIVNIKPSISGLTVQNNLLAANNNQDSAYLYGAPYQFERRLFGSIPANRSSFVIKGDNPNPPLYLAGRFREELLKRDVKVVGDAASLRQPSEKSFTEKRTFLHATYSMPLSQMIRIIHEKSDNLYTEYLLRHLALTVSEKPASAREGIKVVRDFWKQKGLDVTALFLSDACGLSPNDRVSAGFLAKVLQYMTVKSKYAEWFEASLPLAGREGSVASFLKGTSLEGKLRLKSGSIQSVTNYAGYYKKNGKSYIVVMMINYPDGPRNQIRKDMEDFLLLL